MTEPDYITAHEHTIRHRNEVINSDKCGCFCCLAIFPPSEIEEWVDDDKNGVGQTALCPKCGIDSVIGTKSGYLITREFLRQMEKHWFQGV